MLKFMLSDYPAERKTKYDTWNVWRVILVSTHPPKTVAEFIFNLGEYGFDKETSQALASDYVEFLNEKYIDKSINQEWKQVNREERIKYHESEIARHKEQIKLLKYKEHLHWNENGNGVE
jgi:hypothetical protein